VRDAGRPPRMPTCARPTQRMHTTPVCVPRASMLTDGRTDGRTHHFAGCLLAGLRYFTLAENASPKAVMDPGYHYCKGLHSR
jgi:hypothetical protein